MSWDIKLGCLLNYSLTIELNNENDSNNSPYWKIQETVPANAHQIISVPIGLPWYTCRLKHCVDQYLSILRGPTPKAANSFTGSHYKDLIPDTNQTFERERKHKIRNKEQTGKIDVRKQEKKGLYVGTVSKLFKLFVLIKQSKKGSQRKE